MVWLMAERRSKFRATFVKDGRWWVAWADEVPGALTQGRTLAEARANLKDAIRLMLEPISLTRLPRRTIRVEPISI